MRSAQCIFDSPPVAIAGPQGHHDPVSELDKIRKQAGLAMADSAKSAILGKDAATQATRKKWLAVGGVAGGGLGLLFLWVLVSKIGMYLIMLLFLAAVSGGAYYLLKGKLREFKESRENKQLDAEQEAVQVDTQAQLEAQLAELKQRARDKEPGA
jgi:hypothetical protein